MKQREPVSKKSPAVASGAPLDYPLVGALFGQGDDLLNVGLTSPAAAGEFSQPETGLFT
jgi:hypothetical protein